jgi:hypothetical protein
MMNFSPKFVNSNLLSILYPVIGYSFANVFQPALVCYYGKHLTLTIPDFDGTIISHVFSM